MNDQLVNSQNKAAATVPQVRPPDLLTRQLVAGRQRMRRMVIVDRARRYAQYIQQPRRLSILAEGDSWFEYPLPIRPLGRSGDGVIFQLEKLLGYPIANMAHHGDEIRQMLALSQRREIIRRLSDPRIRFDALLFSGGGNDLVGEQFCLWLKETSPQQLDEDAVTAALGVVEAGYRALIQLRDRYSPQTVIFVHGYDFPPVTGIGVCGAGPWLRPSLDFHCRQIGVANPDPHEQFKVVRALLERFDATLQKVAADPQVRRFVVVPTQGTLVADRCDWQNEIHPSTCGFIKIAQKFKEQIDATFH